MQSVDVRCKSEFTYAQEPVSFTWEGEILVNLRIRKRWKSPPGPVFEVQTEDQRVFQLVYLEKDDCWQGQEIAAK
jgi:hypothetical protein